MTDGKLKWFHEDEGERHFVNGSEMSSLLSVKRPIRCLLKSPSPGL